VITWKIRLIAYGLSLLFSLGVLGAAWWKIADHYEDQGRAEVTKAQDDAVSIFAQKVSLSDALLVRRTAERDAARRETALIRAKGREELEHAIEINPEWARAPAMPAPVYDQRVRDLEAIAARARAR
jgi:hypothetical protein